MRFSAVHTAQAPAAGAVWDPCLGSESLGQPWPIRAQVLSLVTVCRQLSLDVLGNFCTRRHPWKAPAPDSKDDHKFTGFFSCPLCSQWPLFPFWFLVSWTIADSMSSIEISKWKYLYSSKWFRSSLKGFLNFGLFLLSGCWQHGWREPTCLCVLIQSVVTPRIVLSVSFKMWKEEYLSIQERFFGFARQGKTVARRKAGWTGPPCLWAEELDPHQCTLMPCSLTLVGVSVAGTISL